jgi:CheY-like chemotaxis protein
MKVLIVDDEPVSRRILKRLLSRFSEIDLQEAEDGEVAWATLGESLPGLVLCDLSMPIMDGTTFIKKVREHPVFGDLPVIVISAANDRETLLEIKDLRILDYLLKPFDLVQTFSRLERHIQPRLAEYRARAAAERAASARAGKVPRPAVAATEPDPAPPVVAEPAAEAEAVKEAQSAES